MVQEDPRGRAGYKSELEAEDEDSSNFKARTGRAERWVGNFRHESLGCHLGTTVTKLVESLLS